MKNNKKNGSIPVHTILETTDYNLFVCEISGNRAINQSHVAKLKNKIMKKHLKELFIIVGPKNMDGKHPIYDGQHSFSALKDLNYPVRYMVVEYMKPNDISMMNTDKLNWQSKDYLKKYCDRNNENYVYYRDYMDKFSFHNKFRLCTTILNGSFGRSSSNEDSFKAGDFEITSAGQKDAETVGYFINQVCSMIADSGEIVGGNTYFVMALLHALGHHGFKKNVFLKKVKSRSRIFRGCSTSQQWFEVISDTYNHRNMKNKVHFRPFNEKLVAA
tara:strand:+ start:144 stop:962 length:819 start_codon:yes stop_codon:yes gene_type:complete